MSTMTGRHKKFTLVELLVVISIIAILAGLLMPAISKVLRKSKNIACVSNLKQIGISFASYMTESKDTFPYAAGKPSVTPDETPIQMVLKGENDNAGKVYCCPEDVNPENYYDGGAINKTFYESEGTSYEYFQMLEGRKLKATFGPPDHQMSISKLVVMYDFECFHGKSGVTATAQTLDSTSSSTVNVAKGHAKNYLFGDWHVGDFND
jgi:prepilin-type N-terminal cleavage/methylation domain-containing protein/prepilin-type processing-associated H-X9-DG protein